MAITVTREPGDAPVKDQEVCCFCWKPTPFWYTPRDVPCCQKCAATHDADEVPSKEAWFAVTGLDNSKRAYKSLKAADREEQIRAGIRPRGRIRKSEAKDANETPGVPMATFAVPRYF